MYCKKTQMRITARRAGYWEGSQGVRSQGQGSLLSVLYSPIYHNIKKKKEGRLI